MPGVGAGSQQCVCMSVSVRVCVCVTDVPLGACLAPPHINLQCPGPVIVPISQIQTLRLRDEEGAGDFAQWGLGRDSSGLFGVPLTEPSDPQTPPRLFPVSFFLPSWTPSTS